MFLCKAKRKDNNDWVEGYVWTGADHSYIIPYNIGIDYTNDMITAFAHEVIPESIISFETFINDIVEARENYRKPLRDNFHIIEKICDACNKLKEKYDLSDLDALSFMENDNVLDDAVRVYKDIMRGEYIK